MDEANLTGPQLEEFHRALLSAFPKQYDLQAMVLFGLGENLNIISQGENLGEITLNLLVWAKSRGKLEELAHAAHGANPDSRELSALSNDFGWVASTTAQSSPESSSESKQIGAVNTNTNTEGGTSISGDANAGGDIIGRDQEVHRDYVQGDVHYHNTTIYQGEDAVQDNLATDAQTAHTGDTPKEKGHPPTINHDEPIALFHQLLNPETTHRYMRLLGGPEMGKSHLLTRVLPVIAFQNGWRPIPLDLRNQATTITGSLDFLCQTIGRPNFPEYEKARQAWINRPQVQGDTIEDLLAAFSADRSRSGKDDNTETQRIEHELTTCIVNDLAKLDHLPIVLLFDQVENADMDVQNWLMDHLLVDLKSVEHICVVAGGRTLPEPARSYQFLCCSHQLEPVTQPAAYIDYCKEMAVDLPEQSIIDFAHGVQYIPGQFASLVQNFVGASA